MRNKGSFETTQWSPIVEEPQRPARFPFWRVCILLSAGYLGGITTRVGLEWVKHPAVTTPAPITTIGIEWNRAVHAVQQQNAQPVLQHVVRAAQASAPVVIRDNVAWNNFFVPNAVEPMATVTTGTANNHWVVLAGDSTSLTSTGVLAGGGSGAMSFTSTTGVMSK